MSCPILQVCRLYALYVFAGVEAIAFGAAGFFFGSEVQRRTLEKAEERAEQNKDEASKARALAAAVNSLSLSNTVDKALPSGLSDKEVISIQQIENLADNIYSSIPNPNQ